MRGAPTKWNSLLMGGTPTGFPQLGECPRNPSASIYQLALLWELHSASVNIFWRLNTFASFMMGDLGVHLSTLRWVFSSFWPKMTWPCISHLPSLVLRNFFFPPDEKYCQRETFCGCGRGETKNGRNTKRHQNQQVQNCFEQWKKCLRKYIASNGEYVEGDKSLNM